MSDIEIDASLAPEPEPVAAPEGSAEPDAAVEGVETATETPAEEAVVEPAPEPEPKQHKGAVAELIANRKALREEREARARLEGRLAQIDRDLQDGRILRQAPRVAADVDRDRLTKTAERLNLHTVDAAGNKVPDLDAAARVDAWGRELVQENIAPIQHMTLRDKAIANRNEAIRYATEHGVDVDTVQETFDSVLSQPNGAQLLSQSEVAMTVWRQAVGESVIRGKLPKGKAAPVAAAGAPARTTPAAIVTEAPGRRGPAAAAIKLSPALARVYKEHGLDPTKTVSATKTFATDKNGDIILED